MVALAMAREGLGIEDADQGQAGQQAQNGRQPQQEEADFKPSRKDTAASRAAVQRSGKRRIKPLQTKTA